MKRKSAPTIERTRALCYVRLSQTKDESDLKSPERQIANILAMCERYGWQPEFFKDTDGHKSGTKEDNRPEWLRLKSHLNDPDVAALVVNDTSRAMRNTWRALKLFEDLSSSDVKLAIAVSDRIVDIKHPDGKLTLYMQAFLDEMYAQDAARRARDSVRYRKSKQITVGQPPFGTIRDEKGFLIPTPFGAWKLPSGGWQAGRVGEEPPTEGALWRGYYDTARLILELYAEDKGGYNRIAKHLTQMGYAFRDRWGQPRRITSDDVRRVVANWREYAGIVTDGRAKERVAHEIEDQAAILYDTGRAVFDLDLLRQVARIQEKRSITTRPTGSVDRVYPYGLLRLVYCAHCEAIAQQEDNPRRRTRLSGTNTDKPRYRHAEGLQCGCKRRSVPAEIIEGDFLRLVRLLTLKPETHHLMLELALRSSSDRVDNEQFEQERRAALAKLNQQIINLRELFKDADISREEYERERADRERQIAFWEARTTDMEKKAVELTHCMNAFSQLIDLWETANGDERVSLARGLFQELVFDLDKQQIVDFKLHAWADQYLMLRAQLYNDNDDGGGDGVDALIPRKGGNGDNEGGASGMGGENLSLPVNEKRPITVSSNRAFVDPNGLRRHWITFIFAWGRRSCIFFLVQSTA